MPEVKFSLFKNDHNQVVDNKSSHAVPETDNEVLCVRHLYETKLKRNFTL